MASDSIVVKSHVARDFEQAAALFKTENSVIWEYVANGLQYVDPGVSPVIQVILDNKAKKITISDNGRGMDASGLQNFFIMHGENEERKRGKIGRGNFGTGKSAAFGIADTLKITTVRNRKLSSVELRRQDLKKMESGAPVPVKVLELEAQTDRVNGTVVEIEAIHLRSLDQSGVMKYLEKHLAHARKDAIVLVNNHECEYSAPPINSSETIHPSGRYLALGDVALTISVAKAPLESDLRGVAIFSNGVWHQTTLAGSDNKEMAQYIFGEIDVPALDTDQSPIRPFDMSRSMNLNPNNELVQLVFGFIGENIERVRKSLMEADRKRRESDESKRLSEEASKIADILNEDFEQFRKKFARVKAKGKGQSDQSTTEGLVAGSDILFAGEDQPAVESELLVHRPREDGKARGSGDVLRADTPVLRASDTAEKRGGDTASQKGERAAQTGGFSVDFKNLGESAARAKYDSSDRTIYINLEHPQIAAARALSGLQDPNFKRLSYEVAFVEYSIALAQDLANEGQYMDLTDPIVDIRDSVNRLARKAALLYAS